MGCFSSTSCSDDGAAKEKRPSGWRCCQYSQTATVASNISSDDAAPHLDALVRDKEYLTLERQLPNANLTFAERTYFQGLLASLENQPSKSIRLLKKVLPDLKAKNHERAAAALSALALDHWVQFQYADACSVLSELSVHYSGELNPLKKQDVADGIPVCQVLRGAPRQTAAVPTGLSVQLRRNPLGEIEVPVTIGSVKEWLVLDTGSAATVLTQSTAHKLGITTLPGVTTGRAFCGGEMKLRFAVLPRLKIGRAVFSNVAAAIADDTTLTFGGGSAEKYQKAGIVGSPLMMGLGAFTLAGDEHLDVIASVTNNPRSGRMYLEQELPMVEVDVNGHNLLFSLDSGVDRSIFSVKYFETFPQEFYGQRIVNAPSYQYGSKCDLSYVFLSKASLRIGAATAVMSNIDVFALPSGSSSLDCYYGAFGRDLLSQFRSLSLDFRTMRYAVGEKMVNQLLSGDPETPH